MLGQKKCAMEEAEWDGVAAQRQLIREMLVELWEKGPRRVVAFYSGMGYVFHALNLGDVAADAIYDFYTEYSGRATQGLVNNDAHDVSVRLFAIMLLLGLRTEKARLYVTVDLSEEPRQQSHTRLGIRELLEIQTLVNLVYAAAGKQYAPIMVPKPFELHWGGLVWQADCQKLASMVIDYKQHVKLVLTFAPSANTGQYCASLVQLYEEGKQDWLGQIVIRHDLEAGVAVLVAESMTSSFYHLRDINAFKYILLAGTLQYVVRSLVAGPGQVVFEADFFDHCAPYDLMLLQKFGFGPVTYDIMEYDTSCAKVWPYFGRAMTLPAVAIPCKNKHSPNLIVFLLGPDRSSVVVDQGLYAEFIANIQQQVEWPVGGQDICEVLVDGVGYQLVDVDKFNLACSESGVV
ncbi:hypothetical protein TI03_02520 [Achromatium sp. WMS1]|nr:hypothetical protein TI03_02520 [Achromatium sp. WMS1]